MRQVDFNLQMRLSQPLLIVMIAAVALAGGNVHGQGLLLPEDSIGRVPLPRPIIMPRPTPPVTSYRIKELSVNARIENQIAQVQVAQSFVNTGSRQMQVQFVFPLPYDGAIDSLTLMVDGKEFPAQLMTKEKARQIYEGFMSRNQDPALLEWMGTGMFRTSVFPVPPGAVREVIITYKQLLRKDLSLTDFLMPLGTAKYTSHPIEKIDIKASIESETSIKNVYSPTHGVDIERPDEKHAVVTYTAENEIPHSDFRLFYDVTEQQLGASVISYRPKADEDGYFLLLASPDVDRTADQTTGKNVICVFDRSGSMRGSKFEQTQSALKYVLNNLSDGDYFNLVGYDTEIESFHAELQPYNENTRKAGIGFVNSMYASGGTNIDGALQAAFSMMAKSGRPNYILFVTDGRPTIGETSEPKIVKLVEQKNSVQARLISFGVGFDVNSRLLDRLSRAGFGTSEYVRPNEDIESHVARLYNKINAPVMTNVEVGFEFDDAKVEDGSPITRVYPRRVHDLFRGEQLVVVGRYRKSGPIKVRIKGDVRSDEQHFDFPAKFEDSTADDKYAFVAKLWAMRRIGQLIDELDLHGSNDELIKELVQLSTQHGILTPYTSFLADDTGRADLAQAHAGRGTAMAKAAGALQALDEAEGRSAFLQRRAKKYWQESKQVSSSRYASSAPGNTAAAPVLGGGRAYSVEADREVAVDNVRNVGTTPMYRRGKLWIAGNCADLDPASDQEKIEPIKRFSKDYFALVRGNTKTENELLTLQRPGEELLIRLRGQAYRLHD